MIFKRNGVVYELLVQHCLWTAEQLSCYSFLFKRLNWIVLLWWRIRVDPSCGTGQALHIRFVFFFGVTNVEFIGPFFASFFYFFLRKIQIQPAFLFVWFLWWIVMEFSSQLVNDILHCHLTSTEGCQNATVMYWTIHSCVLQISFHLLTCKLTWLSAGEKSAWFLQKIQKWNICNKFRNIWMITSCTIPYDKCFHFNF